MLPETIHWEMANLDIKLLGQSESGFHSVLSKACLESKPVICKGNAKISIEIEGAELWMWHFFLSEKWLNTAALGK